MYLTHGWDPNKYYHSKLKWTWEYWKLNPELNLRHEIQWVPQLWHKKNITGKRLIYSVGKAKYSIFDSGIKISYLSHKMFSTKAALVIFTTMRNQFLNQPLACVWRISWSNLLHKVHGCNSLWQRQFKSRVISCTQVNVLAFLSIWKRCYVQANL